MRLKWITIATLPLIFQEALFQYVFHIAILHIVGEYNMCTGRVPSPESGTVQVEFGLAGARSVEAEMGDGPCV